METSPLVQALSAEFKKSKIVSFRGDTSEKIYPDQILTDQNWRKLRGQVKTLIEKELVYVSNKPVRQGGALSYHVLKEGKRTDVPEIYEKMTEITRQIIGEPKIERLEDEAHACAVYVYEQEGDFVKWHYDTSWYRGRRYTVLVGLENEGGYECGIGSDGLECRSDHDHANRNEETVPERSKDANLPGKTLSEDSTEASTTADQWNLLKGDKTQCSHAVLEFILPGEKTIHRMPILPRDVVMFDGDQILHRVTPNGKGDNRVVLTLEYLTDKSIHPFFHAVERFKDYAIYFGATGFFEKFSLGLVVVSVGLAVWLK